MAPEQHASIELYQLYLSTAERVSDRRAAANNWMLSVNAALVGISGYATGNTSDHASIWQGAVPVAGMIICMAWMGLLSSYRKLNAAKFRVLQKMEAGLVLAPFTEEEAAYRASRRRSLAAIEIAIPAAFAALYIVLLALTL